MLKHLNNKLVRIIEDKTNKEEVINGLINLITEQTDGVISKNSFKQKIYEREQIGTTGIGKGIVVPHARCEDLKNVVVAIGVLRYGIDINTPDDITAKVFIVVGAPKDKNNEYLELLSNISRAFRTKSLRDSVLTAETTEDIIESFAGFFGAI